MRYKEIKKNGIIFIYHAPEDSKQILLSKPSIFGIVDNVGTKGISIDVYMINGIPVPEKIELHVFVPYYSFPQFLHLNDDQVNSIESIKHAYINKIFKNILKNFSIYKD